MNGRMNGRLVAREELRSLETEAMFRLLDRHFAGVSPAQFAADLAEKNWVVLIESGGGELVGFSTLLYSRYDRGGGGGLSVVSSGDTVMDPRAWTSPVLARTWIRAVRALHAADGRGTLYWLLLTSGVRTYRFLPLFWREFYPRYDRATPIETSRLLERLARERYGERYDRDAGVVRFARPQVLRGHLPALAPARLRDPHAEFFVRENPGHARGDELVCLTEVSDRNLTRAGRRMVAEHGGVAFAPGERR